MRDWEFLSGILCAFGVWMLWIGAQCRWKNRADRITDMIGAIGLLLCVGGALLIAWPPGMRWPSGICAGLMVVASGCAKVEENQERRRACNVAAVGFFLAATLLH